MKKNNRAASAEDAVNEQDNIPVQEETPESVSEEKTDAGAGEWDAEPAEEARPAEPEQSYTAPAELIYRETEEAAAPASEGAETAQAFLDALDGAQLLLYNSSGEARIEGPANARELRAALAAKAA